MRSDGRAAEELRPVRLEPDFIENPLAAVMWVRLIALCIGLAGLFGGIGIAVGMWGTSEPEIHGAWSMGIIPTAVGLGLLVFYYLSRKFAVPSNGD